MHLILAHFRIYLCHNLDFSCLPLEKPQCGYHRKWAPGSECPKEWFLIAFLLKKTPHNNNDWWRPGLTAKPLGRHRPLHDGGTANVPAVIMEVAWAQHQHNEEKEYNMAHQMSSKASAFNMVAELWTTTTGQQHQTQNQRQAIYISSAASVQTVLAQHLASASAQHAA